MIIIYLIKSTLCLGVLFGFYKIALESKAMHQFKRFYLLASLIFAFTIPLVTFTYQTEIAFQPIVSTDFTTSTEIVYEENTTPIATQIDYTAITLWSIYGLGVFIFGVRFILNLVRLKRKINTAETFQERDFTLALLGKTIVPHSFFKWIFLNKTQYLNKEIAPEVLAHEATHVRQKHSVDILFIEFLQVIFWFNPLIWLSKVSIKLNHEFLADQGAIEDKSNIAIYQNILLSYASSTHHTALESPFNYSLTKKRILMLSQSFSKRKVVLRALLLIPVVATCAVVFNQAIVAEEKLVPEIPILGEWIDQKNEVPIVTIFKENDSLWANLNNDEYPVLNILEDSKGYYLKNKNYNRNNPYYLSVNDNGELQFGDNPRTLIPISKSVMRAVQGEWQNKGANTTYIFYTGNGIMCDIIEDGKKPVRYWPNLKNGGVTFTMGNDWVSFKREGDYLVFTNKNKEVEVLERSKLTALNIDREISREPIAAKWLELWQNSAEYKLFLDEVPINNKTILEYASEDLLYYETKYKEGQTHVSIWTKDYWEKQNEIGYSEFSKTNFKKVPRIDIDGNRITINGNLSSLERYVSDLNTITQNWTTVEYRSTFPINITVENRDENFMKLFDQKLQETNHWKATISYNKPSQESTYATQFIEGAKRNGKNAIVIEVKNDSIYVNGTYTSIKDLRKTIDVATANWSKEEYADPMRSIIFKGNTEAFIQRAEKEFQKTALYRANTSLMLIPPPPAPPSPAAIGSPPPPPPPPPPVSPKEHFVKMQKLGGVFFYEGDEISFDKAISLLKNNKSLNVQTPFPYNDPPRTFIGKVAIPNLDITPSIEKEQNVKRKRGDTLTITDTETRQKALIVMEDSKYGIVIDKLPEDPGVGAKELATYNRLAKKYNANPTGKILQGEVIIMYEIYTKMNVEQKKNAETYPILPPPPPPPPVKVIKDINDNDKNNPPSPALKRGVKSATQEELNVYKRLAKKYNANPTGKVLQGEVIIMYEIYTKMSAKQKKNAETYPILPPPPPPPPIKVIKGKNDGDNNPPPPPPNKNGGYSVNDQSQKTLSLFSKIEEHPEDNLSAEIPDNLSFTPSSVQTISQNIKSTEAHNKAMDSILASYNLTREDTEVKTTTISRKEPTLETYTLGGYSVSTGLNKDYSQEYQVTQRSSFTIKKSKD